METATSDPNREFPFEDALCERCGYPLKGLGIDSDCPECGQCVRSSSPEKRDGLTETYEVALHALRHTAPRVLVSPAKTFRTMRLGDPNSRASMCLDFVAFLSAIFATVFIYPALGLKGNLLAAFLLTWVGVYVLTHIEMLGVSAISKRRGWRVPYSLAKQVCCYASVGWLPGLMLAAAGAWLLRWTAISEPWFNNMLGLVRVAWLFYGLLFVTALLWFETLVWIGVRQVRFANAWPNPPQMLETPLGEPPEA